MRGIKLKNKLILAPMAGVTNIAFRILCKEYGAALAFTEMISVKGVNQNNSKTKRLIQTCKEEKPVGIQLFGNESEGIVEAAKIVEKDFDLIDFNLGCPTKKIVQKGYGAALLKDKKKIFEIMSSLSELKKPISAKIRLHKDPNSTVKIAKVIEKAGASLITVHPRTINQHYSGKADWSIIKKMKESVSIPVIGSGDIRDEEDIPRMIEKTGCDYVMIGRKAIGNPYFFKQCLHYLETGKKLKDQTIKEKTKDFSKYLKLTKKYKVSDSSLKHQAHYFTLGMRKATEIRERINRLRNRGEITEFFRRLK